MSAIWLHQIACLVSANLFAICLTFLDELVNERREDELKSKEFYASAESCEDLIEYIHKLLLPSYEDLESAEQQLGFKFGKDCTSAQKVPASTWLTQSAYLSWCTL